MSLTVMTRPASEVTGEAIASNASLVLRDTELSKLGTYPHGGAIDYDDVSAGPSTPRDTVIARIDDMISRSDIVKLSDGDLAWLRPGDRHSDAIRWLMSRGPAILVVTHGDTAATVYTRSGSVHVRGQRVEVTDAAEWGDAFVARLLNALTARDLPARRSVRNLRSIGLDDLRGILHDVNVTAARAVTPAAV